MHQARRPLGCHLANSRITNESGLVYLWTLFLVALIGAGLARGIEIYATTLQRDRERELLFVGNQFRQAILSYYEVQLTNGKHDYPPPLALPILQATTRACEARRRTCMPWLSCRPASHHRTFSWRQSRSSVVFRYYGTMETLPLSTKRYRYSAPRIERTVDQLHRTALCNSTQSSAKKPAICLKSATRFRAPGGAARLLALG